MMCSPLSRRSVRTAVHALCWALLLALSATQSDAWAKTGKRASTAATPVVRADGATLRWTKVPAVRKYRIMVKVPGRSVTFRNVWATHHRPVTAEAVVASYAVRPLGIRAPYSKPVRLRTALGRKGKPNAKGNPARGTKPATFVPQTPGEAAALAYGVVAEGARVASRTSRTSTTSSRAAPVLIVDGQTLRWAQVAKVTSYELATKVPGRATTYRVVSGTSTTPPAVAGATVTYGLRTLVTDSLWALERSITYPADPAPTPVPTAPAPAPASAPAPAPTGSFITGVTSGRWGDHTQPSNDMALLGAKHVRVGVEIGASTSTLDSFVGSYWSKGITVMLLAEFAGRVPTSTESRNVASWASRYGANGSYWAGKANPRPMKWIEFGNETAYTYQFGDNSSGTYAQRAKDYAYRFREARQAMEAAGTVSAGVGLLAQSDPHSPWVSNMFAAVPNLADYVGGWTMHPYGTLPMIASKMNAAMGNLSANGAAPSAAKPMFVTEYGIASDNGRWLQSNYGWPNNMTYAQTAAGYLSAEDMMRTTYGDKLRMLIIYTSRDLQEPGASDYQEDYFGSLGRNNWGSVGTEKGEITSAVRTIMGHGA